MVTSCRFFLFLSPPTQPPQKGPLQPLWIIGRDTQGLGLMTLPPSVSPLCQQTLPHQPCLPSGLKGSTQGRCCCCPALAMPQTHLSPDFNAGSFLDALRCQDFEGGTRCQKTLALETYSYSPERKDSLSKPHPFTATQFPFFVS